jgi:hypothetical protein
MYELNVESKPFHKMLREVDALMESFLHVINFILFWDMNIQSNNMNLGIVYDIPSLTNSTLLTADMILLCTKKTVPYSWFSFPFLQKNVYSPAGAVEPPINLTS